MQNSSAKQAPFGSSDQRGGPDNSLLLGQERAQFAKIFDTLDVDKDNTLNASELRSLFSYLFGEPISTEHLLHFENRYLLQFGDGGGLSKENFFALLEEYERAYGYSIGDDIYELFHYLTGEEAVRISPRAICQAISLCLPQAERKNLMHLMSRLNSNLKGSGDINYEMFCTVLCEIFNINTQQLIKLSDEISNEDSSGVKHPFYRDMLEQRVASFQADRRDAGSLKALLDLVSDELRVCSVYKEPL